LEDSEQWSFVFFSQTEDGVEKKVCGAKPQTLPSVFCTAFSHFVHIVYFSKVFPFKFSISEQLLLENKCYSGKKLVFHVFLSVLVSGGRPEGSKGNLKFQSTT